MTDLESGYRGAPRPRPVTPPRLHHLTFMTLHLDEMVAWYELVAGLQPVYYSEGAAWLTNDEANHRIALLTFPNLKAPADKPHSAGLHHVAFEYATFDQWLDNYIRLSEAGIEPDRCLDHGMTMSMYYVDPEGNGVEIQVDVFRDWGQSKEWMWASQEFAADQVGPLFDPKQIVAARAAGLTPDEIHTAAREGKYFPEVVPAELAFPDVWADRSAENA